MTYTLKCYFGKVHSIQSIRRAYSPKLLDVGLFGHSTVVCMKQYNMAIIGSGRGGGGVTVHRNMCVCNF
jgi:hypothetical protein